MPISIRGTIGPDDYEVVPTELERIYSLFENKWLEDRFRGNDGWSKWEKYLKGLGAEILSSDSNYATPLDYLLERIYSGNFDKVVIKDPNNASGNFILMSRDFAQKALVLGGLP